MENIESLGFHVIPVAFDEETKSPHTMFIKRNSVKTAGNNSTLFAVNVPPYCNNIGLTNIFADCGPISTISIRDRPGPSEDITDNSGIIMSYIKAPSYKFKVAYVTFKNADSIDIALQMSSVVIRYMSTKENPVLTGIEKWITQYKDRYPDKTLVQAEADEYMRKFDEREQAENEAFTDALQPDEEGWVTIPAKKRVVSKQEKKVNKINKKAERKKRIEKELQNFYLFQQREAKRDKIAVLRQQFENDKKRIAQMQQLRKFKPFS